MGRLQDFDLAKFNCSIFVETGTGLASGVMQAMSYKCFKEIHSFEVCKSTYKAVKKHFDKEIKDHRVHLYHNDSVKGLRSLVPRLPKSMKVLFWLDAHYPGRDFNDFDCQAEYAAIPQLPLYEELRTILAHRYGDVILMDDVRAYDRKEIERILPGVRFIRKAETYALWGYSGDDYIEGRDGDKEKMHMLYVWA